MWNWSRDSSNHGGKKESYNKIALALLGRDDGRFLILCFNLVKSLTRIIKICLASLGVWENILKPLGLGVGQAGKRLTEGDGPNGVVGERRLEVSLRHDALVQPGGVSRLRPQQGF